MQSLAPPAATRPARRRTEVLQQHGGRAEADGPAVALGAPAAGAQVAREVRQGVRADPVHCPIGEPALRDAPEVDRRPLAQARAAGCDLEHVREWWRDDDLARRGA